MKRSGIRLGVAVVVGIVSCVLMIRTEVLLYRNEMAYKVLNEEEEEEGEVIGCFSNEVFFDRVTRSDSMYVAVASRNDGGIDKIYFDRVLSDLFPQGDIFGGGCETKCDLFEPCGCADNLTCTRRAPRWIVRKNVRPELQKTEIQPCPPDQYSQQCEIIAESLLFQDAQPLYYDHLGFYDDQDEYHHFHRRRPSKNNRDPRLNYRSATSSPRPRSL